MHVSAAINIQPKCVATSAAANQGWSSMVTARISLLLKLKVERAFEVVSRLMGPAIKFRGAVALKASLNNSSS